MKNTIGLRIKEYRSKIKMTQSALAEKVGVTNRAVSNWESGTNGIDVDLIPAICVALNVSPNELLGTPQKNEISAEAQSIARAFDYLDAPGRAAVRAVLETQRQRVAEYGALSHTVIYNSSRTPIVDMVPEPIIQMKFQAQREIEELETCDAVTEKN